MKVIKYRIKPFGMGVDLWLDTGQRVRMLSDICYLLKQDDGWQVIALRPGEDLETRLGAHSALNNGSDLAGSNDAKV